MRARVLGLMIAVGVAWSLIGNDSDIQRAHAQRFDQNSPAEYQANRLVSSGKSTSGGELLAICGSENNGAQVLLLVDSESRRLASYQVDLASGKVALRSVRNIRWDLEMDEFNGTEPTPERIRALLQSQ